MEADKVGANNSSAYVGGIETTPPARRAGNRAGGPMAST